MEKKMSSNLLPDMEEKSVSEWLRVQLDKRHITHVQLADYLTKKGAKVYKTSISDWLRERRKPHTEHIKILCDWWDFSPQMTEKAVTLPGILPDSKKRTPRGICKPQERKRRVLKRHPIEHRVKDFDEATARLQWAYDVVVKHMKYTRREVCTFRLKGDSSYSVHLSGGEVETTYSLEE